MNDSQGVTPEGHVPASTATSEVVKDAVQSLASEEVSIRPVESTGDEEVDAALARLGELERAPVAEHVAIFEDVHERLHGVLTAIDKDDAGGPPEAADPEDTSR